MQSALAIASLCCLIGGGIAMRNEYWHVASYSFMIMMLLVLAGIGWSTSY